MPSVGVRGEKNWEDQEGEIMGEGGLNSFPHSLHSIPSLQASSPGRSSSGGEEGARKESLQLCLWNLNICFEKVNAKCWLAEMTLVMKSLPLARVFQCLFTFALVSASRWLAEIWRLSRQGATGKLEVEFKFQRRSCKLSFLSPPNPRAPQRTYLQSTLFPAPP